MPTDDLIREQKKYLKIISHIDKASRKVEGYNTGLIGEKVIVATFDLLGVGQLCDIRYLLNAVIKKKKIDMMRRANNDPPNPG
jgi:hypothetical protein